MKNTEYWNDMKHNLPMHPRGSLSVANRLLTDIVNVLEAPVFEAEHKLQKFEAVARKARKYLDCEE